MKLKDYKEYLLGVCSNPENLYIAKDNMSGSCREIILNLKSDLELSIKVEIDYDEEVLISQKILNETLLSNASLLNISFRYMGQDVFNEEGYYAVFRNNLYGIFVPNNFSYEYEIEVSKYNLYKTLNDIILDSASEYKKVFELENKQIIYTEWSWI